jgi:hypothetical protein
MKATTKELIEERLKELNKADYPNIFNKILF